MLDKLNSTNVSTVIGFDDDLTPGQLDVSEQILNPHIKTVIRNKIDDIINEKSINNLGLNRNALTNVLDRLNFIIETNHDGKLDNTGNTITAAELDGYTDDGFYPEYSNVIKYIQDNENKLTKDLDTSYNFLSYTITDNEFKEFLKVLLYDYEGKIKKDILNLYESRSVFYKNDKTINNLTSTLNKFIEIPEAIEPNIGKYPIRNSENLLSYNILNNDPFFNAEQEENLRKIMKSNNVPLGDTLNYYKP
jgi:hypothetical protein